MPKISLVTPCYNAERFIARTIESVRAQTFPDWEYIIVDDGSTDGSAAVVEAATRHDPRIHLVRQPNAGRAAACNTGVRRSSAGSAYLGFLDADDCLEPEMLAVLSQHLDTHSDAAAVHCAHSVIDDQDRPLDPETNDYLGRRHAPSWLGARPLSDDVMVTPFASVFVLNAFICTVGLIRRSVYDLTPGWDETFGFMYDDTDMFLHVGLRGPIHYCSKPLARYRRHAAQDTATEAPVREPGQRAKLYSKWNAMSDLPSDMRKTIVNANRFRVGGLPLYAGLRAAAVHVKSGRTRLGLRVCASAARQYGGYLRRRLGGEI